MRPHEMHFKRKFSATLYKTLRMPVGEMSFYKDFVNDKRGDLYPIMQRSGDVLECVKDACYSLSSEKGGRISRLIGGFFPIYSYELKIHELFSARIGFCLLHNGSEIKILVGDDGSAIVSCDGKTHTLKCDVGSGDIFSVTFRADGLSLYIDRGARPELVEDISLDMISELRRYEAYEDAAFCLLCELSEGGRACCSDVNAFLCGGLSHADMRPIRYEDGTPMIENGRVFFTMTSRLEVGMYQSVISLNPTLCDFRLEGALLFDTGDGICSLDVASSVIFDRSSGRWYIWMCSFSHGHILARGELVGDPRYGIQIVDVKLLDRASESDPLTALVGFEGDEDPDLCFIDGKWNLAVCRLEKGSGYHYYRFVSDSPLDGFTFVDKTPTGEKTGGSFVPLDGEYHFICGSDFGTRARYDVYKYDDFSEYHPLRHNYDDGGFRGWGTVFEYPVGSRRRYFHLTFDRHNASGYNWSYGNLYLFEASEYTR